MRDYLRAAAFGFRAVFCVPFWAFLVLWGLFYVATDKAERLVEALNRRIERAPRETAYVASTALWLALAYAVTP